MTTDRTHEKSSLYRSNYDKAQYVAKTGENIRGYITLSYPQIVIVLIW